MRSRARDPSARSRRLDRLAALGVGICLLAVYATTLDPAPGIADAAKFQLVGRLLGTPHEPGYPVYVLLNALFVRALAWIPGSSPGILSNLLSAVFVSIAGGLTVALLRRLDAGRRASAAGGMILGLLPIVWSQATRAEVYGLHLLFVTGVLLLLVRWLGSGGNRFLWLALALWALSAGNHLATVCLAPGVLAFLLLTDPGRLARPAFWLRAVAVAGLGFVPYLYVVWRSLDPSTVFLEAEAVGPAGVLDLLTSSQHRANLFRQGAAAVLGERVPWIAARIADGLGWLLLLAPLGFLAITRRSSREAGEFSRARMAVPALLVGVAAGNLALVSAYTVPDLRVHLLPTLLVLTLLVALGLDLVVRRIPAGVAGRIASDLAFALPPLLLLGSGMPERLPPSEGSIRPVDRALTALESPSVVISPSYAVTTHLAYRSLVEGAPFVALHAPREGFALSFPFDPVKRYLEDGTPLRIAHQNRFLRPGRPVYCFAPAGECRGLARHGFRLHRIGRAAPGLWRVRSPREGFPPRHRPLPLAFVVHRRVEVPGLRPAIEALSDPRHDPRRSFVVPGAGFGSEVVGRPSIEDRVELRENRLGRVVLSASLATPGWIVLSDRYPARWLATTGGGDPLEVEVANFLHTAIRVPAGRNEIVFGER